MTENWKRNANTVPLQYNRKKLLDTYMHWGRARLIAETETEKKKKTQNIFYDVEAASQQQSFSLPLSFFLLVSLSIAELLLIAFNTQARSARLLLRVAFYYSSLASLCVFLFVLRFCSTHGCVWFAAIQNRTATDVSVYLCLSLIIMQALTESA